VELHATANREELIANIIQPGLAKGKLLTGRPFALECILRRQSQEMPVTASYVHNDRHGSVRKESIADSNIKSGFYTNPSAFAQRILLRATSVAAGSARTD
jgi:hypothetical protein